MNKDTRESKRAGDDKRTSPAASPEINTPEAPSSAASSVSKGIPFFSWLSSKTVREARAMCKHVHKLLQHQRDILSPKAISEVEVSMRDIREAIAAKADKATLENKIEALEKTANQWIKSYPNAAW